MPLSKIVQSSVDTGVAGSGPAFSAYQSSSQTLSSATNTKLQFQTEEWDTNSNYDKDTNYRFQPTVAGYYQINAAMQAGISFSGGAIHIYKNGSIYKSGNSDVTSTTSNIWTVNAIVYCNGSTDYIEIYGYISTGQGLYANIAGTYFQGAMVRAA